MQNFYIKFLNMCKFTYDRKTILVNSTGEFINIVYDIFTLVNV